MTKLLKRKGITLIGMSEAGKTTLGPILGRKLGWPVFDVDDIIIKNEGKLIGEIVDEKGEDYLLDLEAQCVAKLDLHQRVLVTPGSIIYDTPCHKQLKGQTTIIWLDVPLAVLMERFGRDPKKAKAVVSAENGFEALFYERTPLYAHLADLKIDCEDMAPNDIAAEIIRRIKRPVQE
jgi:shikimate kinase